MKALRTYALHAALAVGAFTFVLSPLRAQDVRTDYDHSANFAQYHTFSIYKVHASNDIVQNRLTADLTQALQRKGLQQVPNGGDLNITAIGGMQNEQEYNTFYDGLGGGWGYGGWRGRYGWGGWGGGGGLSTTTVSNIPVGTLAVDFYDSHSHQLVFRGTAQETLSKNSDKNAAKGEKAVDKIVNKFPAGRG